MRLLTVANTNTMVTTIISTNQQFIYYKNRTRSTQLKFRLNK